MSEIDVTKCEYKGGIECHIRDYPILNCVDVKIEDCHYKQLQQLKAERDLLLGQLVILDGEYVTVQITQEQFEEYNKLKAENEELRKRIDYCFEENSPNYDKFCDVCVAKDTCNGNCCYNQIKEMLVHEI